MKDALTIHVFSSFVTRFTPPVLPHWPLLLNMKCLLQATWPSPYLLNLGYCLPSLCSFYFFLLLFTNFTFLPTTALSSSNTASKNLFCCCSDPVSTNFFLPNSHGLYCFCHLFLYFITLSIEKKRREGKLDLIFRVDQMSACNTSSGGSQSPWGCSQDLTESLPSIIKHSPAGLCGKCHTLW